MAFTFLLFTSLARNVRQWLLTSLTFSLTAIWFIDLGFPGFASLVASLIALASSTSLLRRDVMTEEFRKFFRGLTARERALASLLVAPLFEEVVFRGLVLGGLLPYLGAHLALLVSSLLFTVMHIKSVKVIYLPIVLGYGLILGYCYLLEGLLSSLLAHLAINLPSTLCSYRSGDL